MENLLDDFNNAWTIEFLVNVASFRGQIEIEELRSYISKKVPLENIPKNLQAGIGYSLEWDYALTPLPKVLSLYPSINWMDQVALSPDSYLFIYGEKVPVNLAVIHGSTTNHLKKFQQKKDQDVEDQIFFSISKKERPGQYIEPVYQELSRHLIPIHS